MRICPSVLATVFFVAPVFSVAMCGLQVIYQFFGNLHSVSHAQLSLIGRVCHELHLWGINRHAPGWPGSNGLWEEVGLGADGESITYEPNMLLGHVMTGRVMVRDVEQLIDFDIYIYVCIIRNYS